MKANKLTPNQNVLWQSSRMMLPEHKEAIVTQLDRTMLKVKPELDEQKLEEITHILRYSYEHKAEVHVKVFNTYKDEHYKGVTSHINAQLNYIKLVENEHTYKIQCSDIIDASYEEIID